MTLVAVAPLRVLVAGQDGQLARALVERACARAGIALVAIGPPELDITDAGSVARAVAAHRPDVIVNAAAYTAVDAAESDAETARRVNEVGARIVAEAAANAGAVVIHVSTDYVFDGVKLAPYVEGDATGPISVYGATKLAGERAVVASAPRHAIARTAWLHSPWGKNFVKTMLMLAATRDELRVVDDQVGSPTYAPDLADALLALATGLASRPAGDTAFGIYHVAGSGETSWAGLAAEVFAVSAGLGGPHAHVVPIPGSAYPTPARRPANSRLDGARLAGLIGGPLPSWQEGVARCVPRLLAAGRG